MASDHLDKEIQYAVEAGHEPGDPPPLNKNDPVPGCGCIKCSVLGLGGNQKEALIVAEFVQEDLPEVKPSKRLEKAKAWIYEHEHITTPSPETMKYRAGQQPDAVPEYEGDDDLPTDRARSVPTEEAARRLGVNLKEHHSSYRAPCPVHQGDDPNFSIEKDDGYWKCFSCGAHGGDAIDLVQDVYGWEFPEAVNWLVHNDKDHDNRR